MVIYPELRKYIEGLRIEQIDEGRKLVLDQLAEYINDHDPAELNFICSHNSRRSQLSQTWAHVMAATRDIAVRSMSGGVEVTACNERVIACLKRCGFKVETSTEGENPKYSVYFSDDAEPIILFSKLFDDKENASDSFAAVMTCADADDNCPFIPNAEVRIPLRYEDPKKWDDTDMEREAYGDRCRQIATELSYVIERVTRKE